VPVKYTSCAAPKFPRNFALSTSKLDDGGHANF